LNSCFVFDNSHPSGWEMVSQYGLLLVFPLMISNIEHVFVCVLAIFILHFFIKSSCFLLWLLLNYF
jgi:hypothetical protein